MPSSVTLLVRSSAKGSRWRRHGVYASRDEAWVAITELPDKTAHVRLVDLVVKETGSNGLRGPEVAADGTGEPFPRP